MPRTATRGLGQAALAILLVAGCLGAPDDGGAAQGPGDGSTEKTSDNGTAPDPGRWFFDVGDSRDTGHLTHTMSQPATMNGPYANEAEPADISITFGPLSADEASIGHASGRDVVVVIPYSCMEPADMRFQVWLWANGTAVAELSGQEMFVGNFLPLVMTDEVTLTGILEADVPAGSILSASIRLEGCPLVAFGTGGHWTPSIDLAA